MSSGCYLWRRPRCTSAVVLDGITNPEVLDAQVCAEALKLAEDLQVQKLYIASDCLNSVKDTNGDPSMGGHLYDLEGN
jgi:hypothetical protein